ncbi:MAG: caspase family protein [Planctomycetes bacterium]|nr:caspase family protein [Planctomycetota bacterium]
MKISVRFLQLSILLILMTSLSQNITFADDENKGTPIASGLLKGELAKGDILMDSGEFYDLYEFKGKKNEKIIITLTSEDFDTYLILIAPDRQQFDNDDISTGDDNKKKNLNSRLEYTFTQDGIAKIGVSSAKKNITGKYTINIEVKQIVTEAPDADAAKERKNPPGGIYAPESKNWSLGKELKDSLTKGKLSSGDDQLPSKKYIDWYNIAVTEGDYLFVSTMSKDFDTYLILVTPEYYVFENDDINRGVNSDSSLSRHIMFNGTCKIGVTSAYARHKGKYKLRFKLDKITLPAECPELSRGMIRSKLDAGNPRLPDDRLLSWYKFEITEQVNVFLQVSSVYFDTVVFVVSPTGQRYENDDYKRGVNTNSRLEADLRETGVYYVGVTTCRAGNSGLFSLIFDTNVSKRGIIVTEPEITDIKPGKIDGILTIRDYFYENRRAHFYEFDAKSGDFIDLTLTSGVFETLMVLKSPTEKEIRSESFSTSLHETKIQLRLLEAGTYLLVVTSEAEGNIGKYELLFSMKSTSETYNTLAEGENKNILTTNDEKYLGKYIKWYQFSVNKGEAITVHCNSAQFDTFLLLVTPDKIHYENDDVDAGNKNSRVSVMINKTGECVLGVSSYRLENTGSFVVKYSRGELEFPSLEVGKQEGKLSTRDLLSKEGRLADFYVFNGKKGYSVQFLMQSKVIDSFIKVISPSGLEFQNDDASLTNKGDSELGLKLTEDGKYTVIASTSKNEQKGKYSLVFKMTGYEIGELSEKPTKGTLNKDSLLLKSGAFVNWYTLMGMNNRWAKLTLKSPDFDTYLVMITPDGERIENNNASPGTFDAEIRHKFTEGVYLVGVTSFNRGEVGEYHAQLVLESVSANQSASVRIKVGEKIEKGELNAGDRRNDDGRLFDEYILGVKKGNIIQLNLESNDFDTQILVYAPNKRRIRNDDIAQGNKNSRLILNCDFNGDLQILILPNLIREQGIYTFSSELLQKIPEKFNYVTLSGKSSTNPKFYGIFVGITDYPSKINDLKYCREDAIKLAKTFEQLKLMSSQNYVLLTDKQATTKNLKQAFDLLSAKITKDDIFVFFYSGHGLQGKISEKEKDEVDRRQEFIYLYDDKLQDDTLNTYFNKIKAKLTVITIDCCFAGGFARDLISEPKRVGFFSSEEDLTSAVASKFKAGGFLSFFFRKAIEGEGDKDNTLTIGELSHYLHIGYSKNVTSQYAITSEGEKSYQHLVVDRGGVRVNTPFIYR